MKAVWNNKIIAESDETIVIEGNHYFPPDSIHEEYFNPSDTRTTSPGKGVASYYNIADNDNIDKDAAWYYPRPKEAAREIKGYVAFRKGVEITE